MPGKRTTWRGPYAEHSAFDLCNRFVIPKWINLLPSAENEGHFSGVRKCLWWEKSSSGCRPLKAKGVTQEQTANGLTRCFFQGLSRGMSLCIVDSSCAGIAFLHGFFQEKNALCARWLTVCRNMQELQLTLA